ncbi:MAG: conjugal transfer protein TraD [Defluviitaleaceae bacterium]|nr:conjugal transfer protein TraD [Defluviitaleaceae bacterium]
MTEREEQKLQRLREKMAHIKAQEKTILTREKERTRKERTRRLIQLGAIVEKYLDCKDIEPKDFEKLLITKLGEG